MLTAVTMGYVASLETTMSASLPTERLALSTTGRPTNSLKKGIRNHLQSQ
jgi:hypothetical protein